MTDHLPGLGHRNEHPATQLTATAFLHKIVMCHPLTSRCASERVSEQPTASERTVRPGINLDDRHDRPNTAAAHTAREQPAIRRPGIPTTPDSTPTPTLIENMSNNITTIDRTTVRNLAAEVETALAEVFARHGLTAPTVGATYTPTNIKFKVETNIDATDDSGVNVQSPEAIAYNRYGKSYGIVDNALGVEFTFAGDRFRFLGVKPTRPKFPISAAKVNDGREFKLPASAVAAINAAVEAATAAAA